MLARSAQPLQKLKDEFPKQVEVLNGDLADFSLGPKAVDLALKTFGRLDGLVLNHGMLGQVGNISEADPEQWKQGLDPDHIFEEEKEMIKTLRETVPQLADETDKFVATFLFSRRHGIYLGSTTRPRTRRS